MNHRLKISLDPAELLKVYIGRWCRSTCPYPADTVIVETHWNEARGVVAATLEHPTFPEVEDGKEPLIWNSVEQNTRESPRFGFFLRREWNATEERDRELAAAEKEQEDT